MSHIDSFEHSHIGFLANIPVYHPMQKDKEYGFDERSIIIGGGSGEHAIFVVQNMAQCLQHYVYNQSEDLADYSEVEYSSFWSIEDCFYFYNDIKSEAERLGVRAESYILMAIGQFLAEHGEVFVAKGYLDQALFERARDLFKNSEMKVPDIMVKHEGMALGKVTREGKTVWGFSFEDECKEFFDYGFENQ